MSTKADRDSQVDVTHLDSRKAEWAEDIDGREVMRTMKLQRLAGSAAARSALAAGITASCRASRATSACVAGVTVSARTVCWS